MIQEQVKEKLGKKTTDWKATSSRRIYFTIAQKDISDVGKILHKDMNMRLATISGVDEQTHFELIYHFSHDATGELFNVRVLLTDRKNPCIDSLSTLFEAADWSEREIHEMLGIDFKGHLNLKHLLLNDAWPQGKYPLRKDYVNE
ncbi:MAG: NADH-quinone oxidoreductase subunit C [Candidatus Omnitrophota bacterium]|nr:NADH-quinone oxidoreductase subunit C [Candidatus Omnitrophota bacterium]